MLEMKERMWRYKLPIVALVLLSVVIVISFDSADAAVDGTGTGDGSNDPEKIKVERITLDRSTLTMLPEDRESLWATIYPTTIIDESVSWSLSSSGIVSLNTNGNSCTITAIKAGTVVITASLDDKSASCRITVQAITIALDKTSLVMIQGEDTPISVTVTPSRISYELSSKSSDSSVVSCSGTYLSALKEGEATITLEVRNAKTTCSVEVLGGSISYDDYGDWKSLQITINGRSGVELTGQANKDGSKISGQVLATVSSEGAVGGSLVSGADQYLKKCLQTVRERCPWVPIAVEIDGGAAERFQMDASTMSALSDAQASLDLHSDNGGIKMKSSSVKELAGREWKFAIIKDSDKSVDGAEVFKIDMTSGDKAITSFKEGATFKLPCKIGDSLGRQAYLILNDGSMKEIAASFNSITGEVSVFTESWGSIAISNNGLEIETKTSLLSYAVLVVIILIAVICLFLCYRYLLM